MNYIFIDEAHFMESLKTIILKNNDKLNDSEKKIIQFVVSNPQTCSKLSLSKLAKKLYVSESAIFRLCKKLGLSGYSELKFNLDELARNQSKNLKVSYNFAQELKKANNDVEKFFSTLSLTTLYQSIDKTNTVYIYSTGWQQELIAQYLAHELFVIGIHAIVLPAAFDELVQAHHYAKKGDILFVISFNGDGIILNDEISKLKLSSNKLVLVSLTNMRQNKLASIAHYNLYFPVVSFMVESDMKKVAFTPAYYLIDLFINDYLVWHHRGKE